MRALATHKPFNGLHSSNGRKTRKGHIMSKATKEVATVVTVADCVAFCKSAVPNTDSLVERKRAHVLLADEHKHARNLMGTFESAGIDPVGALEYASKNDPDEAKRSVAQTKLDAILAYKKWNDEGEAIEAELQGAFGMLREIVAELNAITGDKTVHKTYEKRGDKTGASGERINHGYMLRITDVSTKSVVNHPTGVELWKSANEAVRALVPDSLSPITDEAGEPVLNKHGEPKFYNMNADACARTLRKAGYSVEFVQ